MDVTFVNPIDGPCLSLMVPVLSFPLPRAQGAPPGVPRVARRFASLVVGNMCALVIDGRALIPNAPALLPDLAACVKDCNPKMRQYGASALTRAWRRSTSPSGSRTWRARPPPTRHCGGEVRGARRGGAGPQCRSSSSWRPRRRRRRTTRRRRCWPRRSGCARRRRRGSRATRRRGRRRKRLAFWRNSVHVTNGSDTRQARRPAARARTRRSTSLPTAAPQKTEIATLRPGSPHASSPPQGAGS